MKSIHVGLKLYRKTSRERLMQLTSSWRLPTTKYFFRVILYLSSNLFAKFGEVNPSKTKTIWKVSKGNTDAVDEQLEAANHQILFLGLFYIFQVIFLPSLMMSILVGPKQYIKSLQGKNGCSWRAVGGCQPPNTHFRIILHLLSYLFTKFDEVNPCRTKII